MRIIHPWVRQKIQRNALIFASLTLLVVVIVVWRHDSAVAPSVNHTGTSPSSTASTSQAPANFNKQQYSVNDPSSLWVVVNKGRILPSGYEPKVVLPNAPNHYGSASNDSHLTAGAARALERMFAAADKDGLSLRLYSGYRSYSEQVTTYNSFVSRDGVAKADTYSARPGHSEHQTGLAADISAMNGKCDLSQCFADTPEGKWLAANAYKYGFILRYAKDSQDLTGYEYEPWHFRYVGTDLAAEINKTGQTLEQFFGLKTFTLSQVGQNYPTDVYQLKDGSQAL